MACPRRYDPAGRLSIFSRTDLFIMKPLISVIIPVYNTEQYLAACLESVCSQTLREIEIICIDDGSEDKSAAVLKDYASRDERIRVIMQANAGRTSARHKGIEAAAGQWIGFVDSDDTITPDFYERLLKNGETYKADISHAGLLFCYPDGHEVPHYGTGIIKQQDHNTGLLDLLDGTQVEPSMCSKLYRRELFRDFRIDKNMERNEDLFGNFILFGKASSAIYEDFCGYHYLQRHGIHQTAETLIEILSVRRKLIEMSSSPIREAAYRLWLSTLVNTLNQISVMDENNAVSAYQACRSLLQQERINLSVLSKKQQFAAKLHLYFPGPAKQIYRVYGKYSQYRYEH